MPPGRLGPKVTRHLVQFLVCFGSPPMRMKSKATLLCGWIVLFRAGTTTPQQQQSSQNNTVFRIGTFDLLSAEFRPGTTGKPGKVRSQPKRCCKRLACEPAGRFSLRARRRPETNNAAGPASITFSLDQAPAAAYQLRISFLIESPSVPAIQVGINGKQGMFYLHPKLDYGMGNLLSSFYPAYSSADVVFPFPGSMLQPGGEHDYLAANRGNRKR